jgi:hypothetical protein
VADYWLLIAFAVAGLIYLFVVARILERIAHSLFHIKRLLEHTAEAQGVPAEQIQELRKERAF